ncbi:carbohydrate ABC transporter permease [Actinomyces slackii]|uniref:sn-glycerol-3-phosphate transport system permease protein ugpA n=1 Tax=Actinomyces slackii TaxID=52774 RepID=A0A448KE77_9ACTO|nr:sugar ABC transporter permease [Actinomyces slackii]VEG75180.1 sn-glycerol-3-phosphate transport system permease protein ugpA [Actinomyces slackii]
MSPDISAPARPTRSRGRGLQLTDRQFATLLMVPATVFLIAFVGLPLLSFIRDSFFDIDPVTGERTFVALENYSKAIGGSAFRDAAWRTAVYTAIVVFFEFCLGLAVALLFSLIGNSSRVFRTIFLYPLMIAPVVAGLLWRFLLIDNFGIVNELLSRVGILDSASDIAWLSDPDIALFSVAIPDIWLTTSFMTLVLFAGLQNIPGDVIEAARIDGARAPTILFRIIIPLLRPVIAVALIIRGIDAARAFDVILIQTNGGPQNSSEVMSMLIYRTMVRFGDPGLASAMSTLYLIVMMVVASIAVLAIWKPGSEDN